MKIKNLACLASIWAASLSGATAATTLTDWTFDNVPIGINGSPSPSAGLGTASALGMNNSYNNTNSLSNPDVTSLAGSSAGGPQSWRIRGSSTVAGSRGNGWSTNAPTGTQGAQFSGSTFGYYRIQVSFDVYATADAEANLQVQYTTDGSTWINATIASVGTSGTITNNTDPVQGTVVGSYVQLAAGWNNQITADLSGISGVDNDAAFAIRLVNASTGTNCVDTTGAVYNNTSGNWIFDNLAIQGTSIDSIVQWTFESYPSASTIITNPVPELGGSSAGLATSIGFNNNYTYAGANGTGSIDASDINNTGGSSSGAAGPNAWRVRGAIPASGSPGIGWNTAAPIGTQGAQYDVSTVGYSNIVCSFDLYFTSAAEAKMCVLYTTNGWITTNIAQTLFYGAKPAFIKINSTSANTVTGTYFYETGGQGFYNNLIVDFTGIPGADNNPVFGFRVVNAATGAADCLNSSGTTYNNSSGNWRFDNVTVGGTAGTPPPAIAFDPNASVDGPFTNAFIDNPAWRTNIAAIYVNGLLLTNSAYTKNIAGELVFMPANDTLLQSSGLKNISIIVPGFGTAKIAQPLAAGVATRLDIITQPAAPSASSGTLTANPVLIIADQYGNGTTNPFPNITFTAAANSSDWILGGAAVQPAVNGIAIFTNLTATATNGTGTVSNYITFTVTGFSPLSATNSASFNIGAAPVAFTSGNLAVLQLDTTANNTTFSIIEIKPSVAGQTAPVNIIPISATGTNALRLSSSGSCGKLSLNDDGTLVCFAAFIDDSSATPDETLNLNRAAAGLDYANGLNIGFTYNSTSLGGSQARSCTALDGNLSWIADDKGGLYQGNPGIDTVSQPNLNPYNNVVVRTFGGVPYVETQKTVSGLTLPVIYALGFDSDTSLYDVTKANNLATDPLASDFYLISTNGGSAYEVLYILDGVSATQGLINKYSLVSGSWVANGTFTNGTSGDSLFATTNGNGGVYLYYTTAKSSNNSIVQVTDAAGWNASMNIISSNVIYTATGHTYVKGLTFTPQQIANTATLTPPPVLTAQNATTVGNSFTITITPEIPAWRAGITGIKLNGASLPAAAYDTTQAGKIVFYPSQSPLLQSPGLKSIVIAATGFSDDTVNQTISVLPSLLGGVVLHDGNLNFGFTNATGVSFSVLATNNLTAPIATWPVVGAPVEIPAGSGQYQFTDPNQVTNGTRFYFLRQP